MSPSRFRPPLYPLAFPIAYLVNFWTGSVVHPAGFARTLVVALAIALAICLVAGGIAGRTRGGLAASAIVVGLLAPQDSPAALLLFAMALLILVEGAIHRTRELKVGPLIDRVMVTLAAIALIAVGIKVVAGGSLGATIAEIQLTTTPRGPVEPPATRPPDIVLLMLDGFPGDAAANLAKQAGSPYDPEAFPESLVDLGFHVQRNSHSNYLLTPMTLASMFSMRHLVDIDGLETGPEATGGERRLRIALDESAGFDVLHGAGYEIVWVDGGFSHIEPRRVDRFVDHGMPNELELSVLFSTFAGQLVDSAAPDLLSDLHRQRVLATLADATRLIDEPHDQPRFVFVHVPSPHSPWVFGPGGEPRTEQLDSFFNDNLGQRAIDRQEALRRVFAQATFIGQQAVTQAKSLVDRPDPPVVVVFSDHGPGTDISFEQPATTDLVERSSNVLATFTPGQERLFDDFTTPVNILPRLFGGYLGLDVPLQPDTIYAWSDKALNLFPVEVPGTQSR